MYLQFKKTNSKYVNTSSKGVKTLKKRTKYQNYI